MMHPTNEECSLQDLFEIWNEVATWNELWNLHLVPTSYTGDRPGKRRGALLKGHGVLLLSMKNLVSGEGMGFFSFSHPDFLLLSGYRGIVRWPFPNSLQRLSSQLGALCFCVSEIRYVKAFWSLYSLHRCAVRQHGREEVCGFDVHPTCFKLGSAAF